MNELNICHLYPDLLNLYGDQGNIISLKKRCEWRGITVNISHISIGDKFDSEQYDIIFLGGGQDFEQEIIQKDLFEQKSSELKNSVEGNKVMLCICGGYQILGKYYITHKEQEIKTLDLINFWTIAGEDRLIGNLIFEIDFLQENNTPHKIVGFENHSGRTYLGKNVRPLGKVIKGYGNNGFDHMEGAIYNNVFCSYSHGSLLPKNPFLADHLISTAMKNKYKDFVCLSQIDDKIEKNANISMVNKLLGKSIKNDTRIRNRNKK